jgi:hypothetical protein
MGKPSYLNFDNESYPWKPDIDYRANPHYYKVGKGEQGVLICEPYKSEIGQFWRFKDAETAGESSRVIYSMFMDYLESDDFVGADMARKYLQMGYTRARRYANYKGGRKYDIEDGYRPLPRGTGDEQKAKAAEVFHGAWQKAEKNAKYTELKQQWKANLG